MEAAAGLDGSQLLPGVPHQTLRLPVSLAEVP